MSVNPDLDQQPTTETTNPTLTLVCQGCGGTQWQLPPGTISWYCAGCGGGTALLVNAERLAELRARDGDDQS